ncbi:bestrophin-like domain [Acidisphaera rubrifaciens]|nr:DUF4239 domain-containing protein [Acidisphaera rubrifaciens]
MASAMHMAVHPETVYAHSAVVLAGFIIGIAVLGAVIIETCTRSFISTASRRAHTDVAAAMLGTIGTTYAVLLALVATVAWEGYNHAAVATQDEVTAIASVLLATDGLDAHDAAPVRAGLIAYTRGVIEDEWPAQAAGMLPALVSPVITRINLLCADLQPATAAATNIQSRLLSAVTRLAEARSMRLHLAGVTLPGIVWTTLLFGGLLTICAGSFVAAPSLRSHLVMSSVLALSGAMVLVLIVALSSPFRGAFALSSAPYAEVLAALTPPPRG